MPNRLFSFDIFGNFACFKKPDINDGLYLTYNILHKPALLGILGAITGLQGYEKKGVLPEYYHAFKDLRIGIEPLPHLHDKGNFNKTIIKYTNTVGYANKDGTLLISEQTLINPGYRCYLLLEDSNQLHSTLLKRLRHGESSYLPYFGKNEFPAWWDPSEVQEYEYSTFTPTSDFNIHSLFIKDLPLAGQKITPSFSFSLQAMINQASYMYFERLPLQFDEELLHYNLEEFVLTDYTLKKNSTIKDLHLAKSNDSEKIIQLF